MSSKQLASAENLLDGNLGGAWNILSGESGAQEPELGIARRFNADHAYSLRDVGAMGGAVVRVRRSSDNNEEDFSAIQVYGGALASFVGAGNDGFVTKWYDQTPNGNDLIQAATISQPKLVNSGTVFTNGLDLRGGYRMAQTNLINASQPITVFLVTQHDSNLPVLGGYFSDGTNAGNMVFYSTSIYNATDVLACDGLNTFITSFSTDTNEVYYTILANGTSSIIRKNGTQIASGNAATGGMGVLEIGDIAGLGLAPSANMSELILYKSNASAIQESIESDIANHYNL